MMIRIKHNMEKGKHEHLIESPFSKRNASPPHRVSPELERQVGETDVGGCVGAVKLRNRCLDLLQELWADQRRCVEKPPEVVGSLRVDWLSGCSRDTSNMDELVEPCLHDDAPKPRVI